MILRRLSLTVLLVAAFTGAGSASALAAPDRLSSDGLQVVQDASGGRILEGRLGHVDGLAGAFSATLHRADAYFGNTLQLVSAVRSVDGRTMMGVFRARLGATAMTGLALSGVDARGDGMGAVLADDSRRFPKTVGRLAARLAQTPQTASAASPRDPQAALQQEIAKLKLTTVRAQDGTVEARIPEGWRVVQLGRGALVAAGPDDAEVLSGVSIPLLDPRGSAAQQSAWLARQSGMTAPSTGLPVAYTEDAAQVFMQVQQRLAVASRRQAPAIRFTQVKPIQTVTQQGITMREVELVGTSTTSAKTLQFDDILTITVPSPGGVWGIGIRGIAAPPDRFGALVPQMIAILGNYRLNTGARFGQVQHDVDVGNQITANGMAMVQRNIKANEEIGRQNQRRVDASMANARAVQDGIDRSTAGFVNYLRGTDYVRDTSTGAQGLVSQSTSNALTRFDPQHFESVPVSQYVKGVNY